MSTDDGPAFTVIVPTYNWSSALHLALQSVLAQTCGDFEVHVVGDGCTDDSAQVVAAFDDPRLHWHNLPVNHGSQWAPNNHGLAQARGRYIAYLGHDDLWWPTHLQTALATFEETGADVVAAATLMYGPSGSGIRAVTGFFPNGRFAPRHFFPPSSMAHRRDLHAKVGDWRPPEMAQVAVDVDFLARCHQTGARIVGTGAFTTFKFNAAWRRDAYRRRDVSEQRSFLHHARAEGDAFRLRELTEALRAAAEDRLPRIDMAGMMHRRATEVTRLNQQYKGSRRLPQPIPFTWIEGRRRYPPPADEYAGFEWHGIEHHPVHGAFRWSGPALDSTLVLPEPVDRPLRLTVLLVQVIDATLPERTQLRVNGVPQSAHLERTDDAALVWTLELQPDSLPPDDRSELRLSLHVPELWRPCDLGPGDDRRWIGLAVGWIEVGPLEAR